MGGGEVGINQNTMKLLRKFKNFELNIEIENIENSSLVIFSGESGCGKTTALMELFVNNYKDKSKVFMESYTEILSDIKVKDLLLLSKNKKFNSYFYQQLRIEELLNTKANKLSKGEQRRLYFYMCISSEADIYFFDEPFSFLDDSMKEIVKKIIENMSTKHLVYVGVHQDIFTITRLNYRLSDGKICEKLSYDSEIEYGISDPVEQKIYKKNKRVFLKHTAMTLINTLIFTMIICVFAMIFSGFKSAQSLRMSIDTLGVFNAQNGIEITPNKIDIDNELLDSTYDLMVAQEKGLEKEETYHFSKNLTIYIGSNIYSMDSFYNYNSELDGYYASIGNPYLMSYFKDLYPNSTNIELIDIMNKYDYANNHIELTISGRLDEVSYSKKITIKGVINSPFFFNSNIPVPDFYKSLNNDIYVVNNASDVDNNKLALIRTSAVKIENKEPEYIRYLSNKYNSFEYSVDLNGYLTVTGNKNISVEAYNKYFQSNNDIFAYSFDDNSNMYCLKDVSFFKNNGFSYVGDLNQESNSVIISKNLAYSYFEGEDFVSYIGKNITINGREWKVNCILDEVTDRNAYFNYDDYVNYIAPSYAYSAKVLVVDYLNLEEAVDALSNNDLGFNCKLSINDRVDYSEHLEGLKSNHQNLMKLKSSIIIIAVVIIGLVVVFSMIIIIKSYRLYTTLDILYINCLTKKFIIIVLNFIISVGMVLITKNFIKEVLGNTLFVDINDALNDFPTGTSMISINYSWLYILLSLLILIVGELFNGRKINYWVKKLFKKI